MSFIKLNFRPGVNRDQTNYSGEGGWFECNKIRFFSGFPQKLGGWLKTSPNSFLGVCRQMWNWVTTFGDDLLAVGTNNHVYIEVGGFFYNITPLRATLTTPATDNCVDTTNGSKTVNINVTAHGCTTGDFVIISGVTGNPGGVPNTEINTEHEVTVVNANNFTITVTTAATSTTSNQGGTAIVIKCQISPGYASTTYGYGWGTSGWGSFGWGLGGASPVNLQQRDWWFDNFDNDLVMNIRNGAIYYWERGSITSPSTSLDTPAVLLSSLTGANSVPTAAMQVLVSQNDKHLLALGCQPYGGASTDFDPLLIRWSSQDEPQVWNPTNANSAGFIRVSRGSNIIRGLATRQEILVWTNSSLYSLQYVGIIQATLPSITGFSTASLNYALNAPAVGTSFPLTVQASAVQGRVDGASPSAGYIGEYKTSGQQNVAITGAGAAVASISLTPGEWLVNAQMCVDVTGAFGGNAYTIMAISSSSGNLSQPTAVNRMTYAIVAVGGQGAGAGTIAGYRVSVASTQTWYLNAATSNNHTASGSISAVRIA